MVLKRTNVSLAFYRGLTAPWENVTHRIGYGFFSWKRTHPNRIKDLNGGREEEAVVAATSTPFLTGDDKDVSGNVSRDLQAPRLTIPVLCKMKGKVRMHGVGGWGVTEVGRRAPKEIWNLRIFR